MGRKRALDRVAMGCCVAAMPPEAFLPVQHDKSVRAKKTTSFLFILHIDNFFIIPYAESSRVPNETEERKMAENMVLSFDGTKLFVNKEVDMDCRAVCVIVHGLCEHQGRYDYLAEKMHEMGFGTYRFDHRGHGRSEGERTYYDDFNQLLDDVNVVVDMAVSENSALPVFLLGHSMGGFAVALYGAKYPNKNLRGIITSGALTQDNAGLISGVPKGLEPHQKLPNELGAGVCSVLEVVDWYGKDPYNTQTFTTGLCYAICDGVAWFKTAVKDFTYPVLMLHGEKDGLVSVQDTYDFFAAASSTDRQMKIYGGLYHEIFNEYCRDEVISDTLRWMRRRL